MVDTALLNWTLNQVLIILIIMTRVGPLLFLMPVMGSEAVPVQVRVFFTVITALVLAPVVPISPADMPVTVIGFGIFVALEVVFGGILSVFVRLVFAAVETAGQMIGIQMGMGMAGVIDPQFGNQVSPVGLLWNIIAILLFLSINGHHMFFRAIVDSYNWVAPGTLLITQATFEGIMQGTLHMFVLAVKIMAPASAAIFFSHVAMGIIAKTVPQIPILIVGLPMNIAIGLVFVGLSLGYFMPLVIANFDMLGRLLPQLSMGMGG